MLNKELQKLLKRYPADIEIKFLSDSTNPHCEVQSFTDENILHTSEGAHLDSSGDPEEWDHEDGRIVHSGKWYLLINPYIY